MFNAESNRQTRTLASLNAAIAAAGLKKTELSDLRSAVNRCIEEDEAEWNRLYLELCAKVRAAVEDLYWGGMRCLTLRSRRKLAEKVAAKAGHPLVAKYIAICDKWQPVADALDAMKGKIVSREAVQAQKKAEKEAAAATATDFQLRGHCQACGRLQTVTKGKIAKHGYTVEDGFFDGVCSGSGFAPMEHDNGLTKTVAGTLRGMAAQFRADAAAIERGEKFPALARDRTRTGWPAIQFAEASDRQKREAIDDAVRSLPHRAESAERIAADLEKLADEVHGKALVKVARPVAA